MVTLQSNGWGDLTLGGLLRTVNASDRKSFRLELERRVVWSVQQPVAGLMEAEAPPALTGLSRHADDIGHGL